MKQVEGQIKEDGKIDLYIANQNITILFDSRQEYEEYLANLSKSQDISTEEILEQLYQRKLQMDIEYSQLQERQIEIDNEYDVLIDKIFTKINNINNG